MKKIKVEDISKLAEDQHNLIVELGNLMCKYSIEVIEMSEKYFDDIRKIKNGNE